MSNAIVRGSLNAIAKDTGKSLAQTFVNAEVVVLVDTSGSMGSRDSVGGKSRYEHACTELAALQGSLPGKIAVISFSTQTMFCPDGVPFDMKGNTDLAGALTFTKIADVPGIRFVVISDGQPDDAGAALRVAASYSSRIDVIYCGPEYNPDGRDFLTKLAHAAGGQAVTADRVHALADTARKLLAA